MSKGHESAFPTESVEFDPSSKHVLALGGQGLTKREYFAAAALRGLMSDHNLHGLVAVNEKNGPELTRYQYLSILALRHADAMIAELDKSAGAK